MEPEQPLAGETYRDAFGASYGERGRLWEVRGVVDGNLIVRRKGKWQVLTQPGYALHIGAIREPTTALREWLESLPKWWGANYEDR